MNLPNLPGDGKLDKLNFLIRFTVLIVIMLVFGFLGVTRLMKIQIVDGSYYASRSQTNFTATQSIQAARGQIFDSEGRPLNTNKTVYKVIVQRAFFPYGEENEIIERTLSILDQYDEVWFDSVPITMTVPFNFTDVSDSQLDAFKERIGVNVDASVDNCIKALTDAFEISDEYDAATARAIAGVRYEMQLRDFSHNNRFTLAEDISIETLVNLKERNASLPGIDIIEEPMRVYQNGHIGAHTRGRIAPISAEEYAVRREQGYSLNDTIGVNGIEFAMESILRGENGTRTIVRNMQGIAVSDEITVPTKPGNSVMLTIDGRFQNDMQDILANHISWLRTMDQTYSNSRYNSRGLNTKGGAAVVVEVKTGKVLALANYPSYDINDLINDYELVYSAELNPMFNRSTMGMYRPGSSFKPITSAAGMYNNVVDRNSVVVCNKVYRYFPDYQPVCTGTHGALNLIGALKWSCNIYYYDVGRRTGIDSLVEAAYGFGIGTNLGLETGGETGRMTTPENYLELMGSPLTSGDTIQAAVGQSETLVTPLHLAVQAATFANDGVRYKPYLVDSVWNYDFTELIYQTEPQIAATYATERLDVYSGIKDGMIAVTENIVWPITDMSQSHLDYLPHKAAVKTGTAEVGDGTYNSVIMGYYPAHDPEIAFSVVLENSEFSRYMIRNIIDSYFYDAYEPAVNEEGLITSPWKRWDEEKRQKLLNS